MKIKHTGADFVTSHAVAVETGNAIIAPGEVLDLSPELAKSLRDSNAHFKLVQGKKTKTTKDPEEETVNE